MLHKNGHGAKKHTERDATRATEATHGSDCYCSYNLHLMSGGSAKRCHVATRSSVARLLRHLIQSARQSAIFSPGAHHLDLRLQGLHSGFKGAPKGFRCL